MRQLTVQDIKKSFLDMQQFVQSTKVKQGRGRILGFQIQERFPNEYISWSGPIKDRNAFKDPRRFFRVMENSPKRWKQPFTFKPASADAPSAMLDATRAAFALVSAKADAYGRITGKYRNAFEIYVRQGSSRTPVRALSQLTSMTEGQSVDITNTTAYASTVEKNAVYMAGLGGVLYYAARQIQKQYPQLGVRFGYKHAADFNAPHRYMLPVLSIGPRQLVRDQLVRPGRNHRSRQRRARRRG